SSRRRHTRFSRDWSSDVCSSDLSGTKFNQLDLGKTQTADNMFRRKDGGMFPVEVRYALVEYGGKRLMLTLVRDVTRRRKTEQARSEERRVGKEWRTGRAAQH